MATTVRIAFVPEHYAVPLVFAKKLGYYEESGLDKYEFVPYPSGSGHLIQSLKKREIDIAVGLTEAFVRGISTGDEGEYSIVGQYVTSPLRWAISTGIGRKDLTIADIKKVGISRLGSGSHVMSFVLAMEHGLAPFEYQVQDNFANLRAGVNNGTTDAFMWEYFTSKKYYDSGDIRHLGDIYTPWPSWVITAGAHVEASVVDAFNRGTQRGIDYFNANKDKGIDHILESDSLDYNNKEDVENWAKAVVFCDNVAESVHQQPWRDVVAKTKDVLREAGVIQ